MTTRYDLFFKHLRTERGLVLMSAGILLAQALVLVALPHPLRFILNNMLAPAKAAAIPGWARLLPLSASKPWLLACALACLGTLYALSALLEVAEEYWLARAVNAVIKGVRVDLVGLLLGRRYAFVESSRKADIVCRISVDSANLEPILAVGLPTLLRAIPTLIMVLAVLARMDRTYAWAMAAMVLAMYLVNSHFMERIRECQRIGRMQTNRFEHNIYQTLQAFPLIKSLSLEKTSSALMADNADALTLVNNKSALMESVKDSALASAKNLMRLAVLAGGGAAVLRGEMGVGDLIVFLTYIETVASPVNEISKCTVKLAKAAVGLERIEEMLRRAREFPETDGRLSLAAGSAAPLRLRDVSFAHPDGPVVLRDFCALFNPGDLVAVVGPSGAGKTTFLKLLNRLVDPTQGEILLAGRSLRDYRLADLRSHVTAIPQEEFFTAGSIRANLEIASLSPVTDEQLWSALSKVRARDFVAALPDGLSTCIGEGGLALSGGEQRRLNVSRAFLRPAQGLFVFDEPTSGLDPESASVFIGSISELTRAGAAVLWSTHRLEEIASAARVLFFHPGHNPVLASHEELLERCPAYVGFLKAGSATPRPASPESMEVPS